MLSENVPKKLDKITIGSFINGRFSGRLFIKGQNFCDSKFDKLWKSCTVYVSNVSKQNSSKSLLYCYSTECSYSNGCTYKFEETTENIFRVCIRNLMVLSIMKCMIIISGLLRNRTSLRLILIIQNGGMENQYKKMFNYCLINFFILFYTVLEYCNKEWYEISNILLDWF